MRIVKITLGLLLTLLALALAVLWAKPPELLRIGANYAAKTVCSNVFLANRDPDEILRDDVQAPGVAILHLIRISIDKPNGIVKAGFLGFIGHGLAIARPGVGCTAVPDGDLTFAKNASPTAAGFGAPASANPAPAAAASSPTAVTAPWPEGEAASKASAPLEQVLADDGLVGPGARAVLVIDHGKLVAEHYAAGFTAQTPLLGWSMSKTVIAGLIGMLVKDGKLSLDQSGFWPAGDGRERIKVSDLLAMSSGLHFNEGYGAVSDITAMLYLQPDMAAFAHNQPLDHPPGEVWSYSTGTAVLLSRIVQDAAGANSADFVAQRLFKPLGMTSATMEADEHGTWVGSSYMYATAHDWARYGQFLLQDGVWKDGRLLPEGYVSLMATPAKASDGRYGMGQTWLWGSDPARPGGNPDTAFGIPPDTFYMLGHDGQSVAVIRSRQLVIVRLGLTPAALRYSPQPLIKGILAATVS